MTVRRDLQKRLAAAEASLSARTVPRLAVIDVTKLPESDRDVYWAGDVSVMAKHGALGPTAFLPGQVGTVVISVHPDCRDRWLATRDLSPNDLDAFDVEPDIDQEERRRQAADVRARFAATAERARAETTDRETPGAITDPDILVEMWRRGAVLAPWQAKVAARVLAGRANAELGSG